MNTPNDASDTAINRLVDLEAAPASDLVHRGPPADVVLPSIKLPDDVSDDVSATAIVDAQLVDIERFFGVVGISLADAARSYLRSCLYSAVYEARIDAIRQLGILRDELLSAPAQCPHGVRLVDDCPTCNADTVGDLS